MLLAFHGKESLKKKTIKAMKADIKAERLVPGHYWNDNKTGCFVGCVIRGSDHGKFETQLGIPRVIARLGDCLFEGLWRGDPEDARKFTVDFLEAIPTGADLSLVWAKFAVLMLADKDNGLLQYAKTDKTKKAILQGVAGLYQRMINGEKIEIKEWLKVRDVAAADDAADAYAVAYAVASAVAYADAAGGDAADARSRRYSALATYLLQLFRECGKKMAA